MKIIETERYPIRYEAFANPGIVFKKKQPKHTAGEELAYCYILYRNPYYPYIRDSIQFEVSSYQGKFIVLHCYYSRPTKKREQGGVTKRFDNSEIDAAIEAGIKWLNENKHLMESI